MPAWSHFKKSYKIEPHDLPNPQGVTICVIERVDQEPARDFTTGEEFDRTVLYLAGWDVPLRLNNAVLDTLSSLFGPNVEDAIGKKVALVVQMVQAWGKSEPKVQIHPARVDDAPIAPVPQRMTTTSKLRIQFAASHGVAMNALPAGPSRDERPMGEVAAARYKEGLKRLGIDDDAFLRWLKKNVPGGVEAASFIDLPDRPAWLMDHIKAFFMSVEASKSAGDRGAAAAAVGPPPGQADVQMASGEVIDRATGEIVRPAPRPVGFEPTSIPGVQRGLSPEAAKQQAAIVGDDDIPF